MSPDRTPERTPVPRARSALQWLAGLLLLGLLLGGLVAAAITLWESVDVSQLTGGAPAPPQPPPAARLPGPPAVHSARGFDAALYVSPATAGFFPDSAFYPALVDGWAARVRRAGGSVRRVSGADALAGLPRGTLLVIPAGLCLSRAETDAIRRHLSAGGGVVATWATGARDRRCEWRGWETVARLAGTPDIRQLEERKALYLTLPGGTPLLDGLPPATRVELRPGSQIAASVGGVHAYWSDWAQNPAPAASGGEADGAAVARTTGAGGRVVWLGFMASEGATPRDSAALERVAEGGLRWAAGVPSAGLAPWPEGHDAALLVAEEAEASFADAAALAGLLRGRGTPGSFYVVSGIALDHPDLADSLRAAGEVGTQTTDHQTVAGLPAAQQRLRLSRSASEVRGWTGVSPVGLRPPEERFDTTTLRVWRELGGTYLLAVNEARTGSPQLYDTPAGRLALLPRIVDSDYNVMVRHGSLRDGQLRDAWLSGARKLGLLGGLAVLSVHTQVAGQPAHVAVVGQVLDSLAADPTGWWEATGRDIAAWWTAREAAGVAWLPSSGDTLALRVTAPPGDSLSGAWLEVTAGTGGPAASVEAGG
ncbi:MAG TPA: polysaccharide deacetylase family protein, partial [Gemmatimonadota bacterium]|nr:polysaccharide deacetylase family protein [Gemmatimonadota bacterium]